MDPGEEFRPAGVGVEGASRAGASWDLALNRLRFRVRTRLWETLSGRRPYQALVWSALSCGLLVAGVRTSAAAALWGFGLLWGATLVVAFGVLYSLPGGGRKSARRR
ncbi:hypothetical protein ACFC1R_32110 [Kitasatospora sp. NPDC056138]|uniref:hypothetical protein n=1 Tax=Kitasatospora sp. NPDC056138 TaxID=3345724 RepID=UPI0035D68910